MKLVERQRETRPEMEPPKLYFEWEEFGESSPDSAQSNVDPESEQVLEEQESSLSQLSDLPDDETDNTDDLEDSDN